MSVTVWALFFNVLHSVCDESSTNQQMSLIEVASFCLFFFFFQHQLLKRLCTSFSSCARKIFSCGSFFQNKQKKKCAVSLQLAACGWRDDKKTKKKPSGTHKEMRGGVVTEICFLFSVRTTWPWQVSVWLQSQEKDGGPLCSGTLISPCWALTSAYCVSR